MARAGQGGGMGSAVNVGIAVQADWENREFISNISLNVRRLFDFLLRFGMIYSTQDKIFLMDDMPCCIRRAQDKIFPMDDMPCCIRRAQDKIFLMDDMPCCTRRHYSTCSYAIANSHYRLLDAFC